jgi:glycosyltransferase involved in cell wall biosynthesis
LSLFATLIAIPAYNEEAVIARVASGIRDAIPEADVLVIDDGSEDATPLILQKEGIPFARQPCNLGYGRTIQTAVRCARQQGYGALITADGDGQHSPEDVRSLALASRDDPSDYLIGSRYLATRDYSTAPVDRRIGMQLFSWLTGWVGPTRVYDTTSGLKVIRATVFDALLRWHFVDFHAEAIVYLASLGYTIGEHSVGSHPRRRGVSMYTPLASISYPVKTLTMTALAVAHARLEKRRNAR